MKTPFIIYIRAIGIYAVVTLPALAMPVMYFISLSYVLRYGWFAWALFTLIYFIIRKLRSSAGKKSIFLLCGVVASVIFAFQMLEGLNIESNIWRSGLFLLFPAAAIIAGWISVFIAESKGDLFITKHDQIGIDNSF